MAKRKKGSGEGSGFEFFSTTTASIKARISRELKQMDKITGKEHRDPEDMIEFAKNHPSSELYKKLKLDWPAAKICHEWRLGEARAILRWVEATLIPNGRDRRKIVAIATHISLPDHRGHGYERIEAIMKSEDRRQALLYYTIQRLQSIHEVNILHELNEVSEAIERAARDYLPPTEGIPPYKTDKRSTTRRISRR